MLRITIATEVAQPPEEVLAGFDSDLFLALKPPLMPLELLRFDGCTTGDRVKLSLGPSFIKQEWHAMVVAHGSSHKGYFFVDIGEKLPSPLKKWRHGHRLDSTNTGTKITDDIRFTTGYRLLDYLMYPSLYFTFWIRKGVYKRIFGSV